MTPSPSGPSKAFVNSLIVTMIISGAANTLGMQSLQNVEQDQEFLHPFMQATTMFVGEGLCIFLFFMQKNKPEFKQELLDAKAKGLNTKVNYFWLMIPALADLITSTLQYTALNYISASIYQMLRGGVIVVTAIFSRYFLKKKLKNYQIMGCALVIVGITLVGISNFPPFAKSSSNDKSGFQQAMAMILILLSLFTNGILFISEEKLFSIYYLHPFQVVGTEGCWGLLFYLILLPGLTFLPCPSGLKESCIYSSGDYFFERPDQYFSELGANGVLLFLVILGVFTIAMFNIAGVSVTKYVSSVARSVVDVTRTVLVWLVGLIVTFANPDAKWENTGVGAILIELLGFSILVFGNLVYNNIVKISALENNNNVRDSINVSLKEGQEND